MPELSAQPPCLQGAVSRLFAALLSWVQAAGPSPAPDPQLGTRASSGAPQTQQGNAEPRAQKSYRVPVLLFIHLDAVIKLHT